MIFFFILGYPQPLQGRPRPGGGGWGAKGVTYTTKNMCYINSRVFISWNLNSDLHFHFRVPPIPARAPPGGGLEGVYHQTNM